MNPVGALFLGWWLADEVLGARTLIPAAIIIGSVVLITSAKAQAAADVEAPQEPAALPLAACGQSAYGK